MFAAHDREEGSDLLAQALFAPVIGSCSIKKYCQPYCKVRSFLGNTYGKVIYGTESGLSSKNFTNMVWWQQAADDAVLDPYKLLLTKLEGMCQTTKPKALTKAVLLVMPI